jgi:hypothetical protein
LQDKWAASALRSATQLLKHLEIRTAGEPRVLAEDNRDVREVLEALLPQLAVRAALSAAHEAVKIALSEPEPGDSDVASLDARNEVYQAAVEKLLNHAGVRSLDHVQQALRAYLRRRLTREHPLYFPVFTGAPF